MTKIKISVAGPGLIGKNHIRLIRENTCCTLSGIVAPDKAEHHEYAQSQETTLYKSLEECLKEERPDGVIIASPNLFHAEQTILCIKAGIPVLVEKPFTDKVDVGRRVLSLAEEKNAKVLVGHHRAHSPLLQTARQAIQEGRLGKLVSVMGSAQFYKPREYFEAGPWRSQLGGGPILINLIHEIGNLRSLCGEISAVQALSSSAIRHFPVEDTVGINFLFSNGVIGTFLLSDASASTKSWEQTSGENPAYPNYPEDYCYSVAGTQGSLDIPTMHLRFYDSSCEPSWWSPAKEEFLSIQRKDPLQCQLINFINVIRGTANPVVSARDGLRNLAIVEAVSRAAEQRKLIEV